MESHFILVMGMNAPQDQTSSEAATLTLEVTRTLELEKSEKRSHHYYQDRKPYDGKLSGMAFQRIAETKVTSVTEDYAIGGLLRVLRGSLAKHGLRDYKYKS